jgi:hypothetical protein
MITTTTLSALVFGLASTGAMAPSVDRDHLAVAVPLIQIPEVPAESSPDGKVMTELQQLYVLRVPRDSGVVRTLDEDDRPFYGRA